MSSYKKEISLVASMIACLCAGFTYAFSVMQNPIMTEYGFSEGQVALCFSLRIVSSTMTTFCLGNWIKKISIRYCCLCGAGLMALGLILSGFAKSPWLLYLGYGFLSGMGVGFYYPPLMTQSVLIFPDKAGLCSGLMAASYGSGALLWAPLTVQLMEKMGVRTSFFALALIFFLIILISSFFIYDIQYESKNNFGLEGINRRAMVHTRDFYALLITFTFGLTAGIMVIGQAAPILQGDFHFNPAKTASLVGVFSLCNTLGRILFGSLSDYLDRFKVLNLLLVLAGLGMMVVVFQRNASLSVLGMGIAAMTYGGFTTLIAPLTANLFGYKYLHENYSLMYIVFGLASLLGPRLAVLLKQVDHGHYNKAFLGASLLCLIGLCLSSRIYRRYRKVQSLKRS